MDIHLIQRDIGRGLQINDGILEPVKKNNLEVKMSDEQLTANDSELLSSSASNKLFENGVGADVLGYIEDGALHEVGTVWLSRNTKGEFKCLVANSDNFIDVTPGAEKWMQIDDLTNSARIDSLKYTTTVLANDVPVFYNSKLKLTKYSNAIEDIYLTAIDLRNETLGAGYFYKFDSQVNLYSSLSTLDGSVTGTAIALDNAAVVSYDTFSISFYTKNDKPLGVNFSIYIETKIRR